MASNEAYVFELSTIVSNKIKATHLSSVTYM